MTSERIRELLKGNAYIWGSEHLRPGEIPAISVYGKTIPEAWERAVLATLEFGAEIKTQYDNPIDPPSRDAAMMMVIADPFSEPRFHKIGMQGGWRDLYKYVQEVVNGAHDERVSRGFWHYTYHQRFFNWPGDESGIEIPEINQIDSLIATLVEAYYSRRAQSVTWFAPMDCRSTDPPCLQRMWCRMVPSEEGVYLLQTDFDWRSRDGLKAAFENLIALSELQRLIAVQLTVEYAMRGSNFVVLPGRIVDRTDSFHVYGADIRKGDVERFLSSVENHHISARVVRSDDPKVLREWSIGIEELAAENYPSE